MIPRLEKSYSKLLITIQSCKTKEQLESAIRMVENFKEMYKLVGYPKILSYNLSRTINKQLECI